MKKVILYRDRNKTDIRINHAINNINKYLSLITNLDYKFMKYGVHTNTDIAILWGIHCIFKDDTKFRKKMIDINSQKGKRAVVIEVGFLNREKYYSIGYNSIVGFGDYPQFEYDSKRFDKLGIECTPFTGINKDGIILLCGQIPWDTQLQHIKYKEWLIDIVKEIRKYTKRKIVYRPHPKQKSGHPMAINKLKDCENSKNKNIKDDFKNAYCVIALNSNSLLDAMIAGIPFYSFDKGSMVNDIANHDISTIETDIKFPSDEIRMQKLYEISYKQWDVDDEEDLKMIFSKILDKEL